MGVARVWFTRSSTSPIQLCWGRLVVIGLCCIFLLKPGKWRNSVDSSSSVASGPTELFEGGRAPGYVHSREIEMECRSIRLCGEWCVMLAILDLYGRSLIGMFSGVFVGALFVGSFGLCHKGHRKISVWSRRPHRQGGARGGEDKDRDGFLCCGSYV